MLLWQPGLCSMKLCARAVFPRRCLSFAPARYKRVLISRCWSVTCAKLVAPQQSQASGFMAGNIMPQTSQAQLQRIANGYDVSCTTLLASCTAAYLSCSTKRVLVVILASWLFFSV